ncbi:MAG: hypothetical protein K6T34_07590, partial [Thermoflavifilum sp.]|nr:hypothetical protein [Thermoflavifilum sp.]
GFGVNVNNSTGVITADTTSGKLATQNYVNNRYTGGTGISVNNSTGVITNTGVVTETDPVANAKSVSVTAGYGLTGGGSNTLGNNPSFTLNVDTTKLATQNYVNNRYTSGFGVNVNNSTGIVSADTTKVTTMNYVNNRYTSGFGVNVNNSTGVVSADTTKVTTTNYVNNRYTSGFGVNVNNSTGVITADTTSGKLATQNYVNNKFSGTPNYLAVFTGSNSLGNSIVQQPDIHNLFVNGTLHLASGNTGDTISANNTAGLTLESRGNLYGRVLLTLQNITGSNGAVFQMPDPGSPQLVDFAFKVVSTQRNIRFETRPTYVKSGGPEFHIGGTSPDNPQLLVADNYGAFQNALSIGKYTTPGYTLDVNGTGNFTGSLTLGSALIASGSAGTTGQVLVSQGAGNAPQWQNPSTALNAWSLTGNAGTTPGTNFLGTTDNQDLVFKTNNTEQMRITNAGNVGIGTSNPQANLHVIGSFELGANGTPLTNIIKTSVTPSVPFNFNFDWTTSKKISVTVTGANPGNIVIVNPRGGLPTHYGIGWAAVTAPNTVTINIINTGNNDANPSTQNITFDILIIQ